MDASNLPEYSDWYDEDVAGTSDSQETLDLQSCNLDHLPTTITQSNNPAVVRRLLLNENLLRSLPTTIVSTFKNLVTLDVSNNSLSDLPDSLCQLSSLRILTLSNNRLEATSFPKCFGKLQSLEILNCSGNRIAEIPPSFLQLNMLKALYLGGNQLEVLPYHIGKLSLLQILYLGGNQLQSIPATIGCLRQLISLVLCDNNLETIPSTIADLENLESLSLHNNHLTTLPPEIIKLQNLHQLSLRNNPLVVQFVRDMTFDPPSMRELAARIIKQNDLAYKHDNLLPTCLVSYLDSANQCVNPKCKGYYFEACVEHVKFVDFCGKFRVPLLHYLCSPHCLRSPGGTCESPDQYDSDDNQSSTGSKMKKILLG